MRTFSLSMFIPEYSFEYCYYYKYLCRRDENHSTTTTAGQAYSHNIYHYQLVLLLQCMKSKFKYNWFDQMAHQKKIQHDYPMNFYFEIVKSMLKYTPNCQSIGITILIADEHYFNSIDGQNICKTCT